MTSLKLIAKRYLKFYFWVDLLGCLPFDHFTNIASLHILSLLKTVRLLRFQKLIHFIGIGTGTRSKIRMIQLILTMLMFIHWATCYFYVIVTKNYQNEVVSSANITTSHDGESYPRFNFQYWIPQNHLNDGQTDFYTEREDVQYIKLYYYMILLTTGNDVMPQTSHEVFLCSLLLLIGAILVASIFGSISAEIQRAKDQE